MTAQLDARAVARDGDDEGDDGDDGDDASRVRRWETRGARDGERRAGVVIRTDERAHGGARGDDARDAIGGRTRGRARESERTRRRGRARDGGGGGRGDGER